MNLYDKLKDAVALNSDSRAFQKINFLHA